jgi:penicillin amidase
MGDRLWRSGGIVIERDAYGVPHVEANDALGLWWGMGYCHGADRGLQMLLMRVLGGGHLSLLEPSDRSLAVDTFFRRMNWTASTAVESARLSPEGLRLCTAYAAGANAALHRRRPWELSLVRYQHRPWTVEDSLVLARMTGYLTLAQSQAELERFVVEMVQAGVDRPRLEELFPGLLEGLDESLLRAVRLGERVVPAELTLAGVAAPLMSSNNWAVAGGRTASGRPLLASDPHLEVNRLPNVWYEIVLRTPERYAMGATMPGIPAVLIGRTTDLAWGATYAFMDAVDSWIERCQDGRYRRRGEWVPFGQRREVIGRRGRPAVEVVFHENDHGILDGDPREPGLYLATRWSSATSGARSVDAMCGLWNAGSVAAGMRLLGQLETAFNWVLADRHGDIGYQMSGLLPCRRPGVSGLVPLPGWDPANDWQGFVAPEDLPRVLNPTEGFVVTANNDLNHLGRVRPISVAMGPWRAERIAGLLDRTGLTAEDMRGIQLDLYSRQAARFLTILRPLLPDTPSGRLLRDWDCRYDAASRGAALFESWYTALRREVFGPGLGRQTVDYLERETGLFADFYDAFDRVLLAERSAWFAGATREQIYRRVAAALPAEARRWGESRQLVLRHLLLGGRLPRWLGFDRGPVTVEGGRATVHQAQVYRSAGRDTSFAPSIRIVADLAEDGLATSLLGGPSDRRWSRWYCPDVETWRRGRYKRLRPSL